MKRNNGKRTGGKRMEKMLESGLLKLGGGKCIDLYNQSVCDGVFAAVTTRVDACNHYWVTQTIET